MSTIMVRPSTTPSAGSADIKSNTLQKTAALLKNARHLGPRDFTGLHDTCTGIYRGAPVAVTVEVWPEAPAPCNIAIWISLRGERTTIAIAANNFLREIAEFVRDGLRRELDDDGQPLVANEGQALGIRDDKIGFCV